MILKYLGTTIKISMLLAVMLALIVVILPCVSASASSAVSASDGNRKSSQNVTAVNLKEDDWTYSVHKDGDGNEYSVVTGYSGKSTDIDIPSELGGYKVRSINREAFSGNKYLVKVSIPEGVTDIGKYSFKGCVGISRLQLPSTLKTIHEGAFYGCKSLTELELPDSVNKLGSYAFYNCWHITSVKLSDSLKSVGDYAFSGCSMLRTVEFGEKTEAVGSMAFRDCTELINASLPSSVTSLGAGAFMNCTSLKKVSMGDGLTEIRKDTFRGCTGLNNIDFGSKVKSIGDSAFEGCTSLTSVSAKGNVEEIGMLSFYNCSALNEASFGDKLANIGLGAFNGCEKLKSVTVGKNNKVFYSDSGRLYRRSDKALILCPQGTSGSVKIAADTELINDYAFAGCGGITDVVIPESVKEIGSGAFIGCTEVTVMSIPDSVQKIGCMALGYYLREGRLKKVSYLNVFGVSGGVAELYCTAKSVNFTPYSDTMLASTDYIILNEGKSFVIKSAFLTARKGKIKWTSSDESVATVDKNGKVKAVSLGEAQITMSCDGFEDKIIDVKVIEKNDDLSDEQTALDEKNLYLGEGLELNSLLDMIIDPLLNTQKYWYSSDPGVACVSSDGHVTSYGAGSAKITCRFADGSERFCTIKVVEKPTEFSLIQLENELKVGETFKIQSELTPRKSNDEITWKSNNDDIAVVDDYGNVTVTGQGKCTITATTASGIESSVEITCVIPVESIELDLKTRDVYQGKEFNLDASLTPPNSKESIKWSSSDTRVAKVNSKGKVTGVSFGTAIIYAETSGGDVASCKVNVIAQAEYLSIDVKKLTLNVGTERKLNAIILPSYSPETTDKCTWSSTDEKVANVDESGVVSAVSAGSCIINCRVNGELIAKCIVTVKQPTLSAEISGEKNDIYVGDVLVLKAVLTPENTTDTLEWSSDNTDVAYVTSKGSVKGKSCGTATITLKVTNEVSGNVVATSFTVNVLSKAEGISLNRSSISLKRGSSDSLSYTLTPSDSNDTVRWTSSDESVAEVRSDGLITAVGEGSCYIYAETGSGKTARCKVNVSE